MGWIVQTKAERTFNVLIQEQEADCGLCCVAMVVNLLGQGKPTSASIKTDMSKSEYNPSTKDRAGMKATVLAQTVPTNAYRSLGTYLVPLKAALARFGIASAINHPAGNVQNAIAGAVAGHPIICHVTWAQGGGHWVVITHAMGAAHYILDPYWGLQINTNNTQYQGLLQSGHSPSDVERHVYGTWTGEWLKVL